GTLGQHLVGMLMCPAHGVKHGNNEVRWNIFVKQVADRIDKDAPWLLPAEWPIQAIGPAFEVKSLLKVMAWHTANALSEGPGIAPVTPWAHFRAACDGVPACIRPFDTTFVRHGTPPYLSEPESPRLSSRG
ncbi:MAG TPA: hypothetical protein VIW22_08680, partial [Nitrososphaerales archaeon]